MGRSRAVQMMLNTPAQWNVEIDLAWRMVEGLSHQKFGQYLETAKIEYELAAEEWKQKLQEKPLPSFLGLGSTTVPQGEVGHLPLTGVYTISQGNPLLKFLANTKVGFLPQQFQFEGGGEVFSSTLHGRSEGISTGKGAYEELYVNVKPSEYEAFIPELESFQLAEGKPLDQSVKYYNWEEKKIFEIRFQSELETASERKTKTPYQDYVSMTKVRNIKKLSTLLEYLKTTSFYCGTKSRTISKEDRKDFRKTTLHLFSDEAPVVVTIFSEAQKARSLRRLVKGTHVSKDDPVKNKAFEKAVAIMGVTEGYRNVSDVAHLLTMLSVVKYGKATLQDFRSETSDTRWVPRGSGASSKLVDFSNSVWGCVHGTTAPDDFTAPFRNNLLKFFEAQVGRTTSPAIKGVGKAGQKDVVLVEAATQEDAEGIVRDVLDRKLIRHL